MMFRLLLTTCCLFILIFFTFLSPGHSFTGQVWLAGDNGIYQSVFNARGEPVLAELRQSGGEAEFSAIVISHLSRQKCIQIKPQTSMQVNGVDFPVDWACSEMGEDCVERLTVTEKQYIDLFVDSLRRNLPVVLCFEAILFPGGFTAPRYDRIPEK